MKIVLRVQRFQPEQDPASRFQDFEVEVTPESRLLDALILVERRIDPTLTFRRSCGHGVCGSDAMVVNGKERLACKTLVKDVAKAEGEVVTIEPLRTLKVVRDLVVDERPFFELYKAIKPYLVADEPPPERERRQSPAERKVIDETTNCILCEACYSACPVVQTIDPRFIGPAAIVQAFRFDEDSRDKGFAERLPALDRPDGIWACENKFECTRVCPRDIRVTWHINFLKRQIEASKRK
jgi:succinate dehydrogenase / fumarate reductase iron-sulfur subunit